MAQTALNRLSTPRAVLGFAVAPLLAAAALTVFVSPVPDLLSVQEITRTILLFATIGAYPSAILFGIPALLVLRNRAKASPLNCCLVGASIAILPWAIAAAGPQVGYVSINGQTTVVNGQTTMWGWIEFAQFALPVGVAGAIGGLIFWAISFAGMVPVSLSLEH